MTKTKTVRAFNPTTRPAMMKRNTKGQFVGKKRRSSTPKKRRRNPSYGTKRPRRRTTTPRRAANPSRPRRRRRTSARRSYTRRRPRRTNPQRITGSRVIREFQHLAIAGLAGGAASMGMDQVIGWAKRQAIKGGWLDGLAGDTVRAGRIAEYGGDALTLVGAAILGVWAKGRVKNRAIANGLAYGPAAAAVSRLMQRVIAQAQAGSNNTASAPVLLGYQQPQSFPRIPGSGTRGNLMDTLYWGAGDQRKDLRGYLFEGDTLVSGPTASDAAYTSF